MSRWFTLVALSLALGAGLILKAGVYPTQWNWSLLLIALAGVLNGTFETQRRSGKFDGVVNGLMIALLGWAAFQMVPLPEWVIARITPARAELAHAAGAGYWIPISVNPARTFQLLINAGAFAVVFLLVRNLGWHLRKHLWLVMLPLLLFAGLEAVLGIFQFAAVRDASLTAPSNGTYVNPDHFSGFLEMALPLAAMSIIAAWRHGVLRAEKTAGGAARTIGALTLVAVILMAIVVSLSRMGFVSAVLSLTLTGLIATTASQRNKRHYRSRLAAGGFLAVALAASAFAFLPTDALIFRFSKLLQPPDPLSELPQIDRAAIWHDTRKLIEAYPVTGSGLGTFESGLIRYKHVAPMRTADYAHNDYLQVMAELGGVGFVLAMVWVAVVYFKVLRAALRFEKGRNWEVAVGLAGAMTALLLHSLADFNLYIPANAMVFAWICGAAASAGLENRAAVFALPVTRVVEHTESQV